MEKDLKKLAIDRANRIIEDWWYTDTWEWADEENLTEEEIKIALSYGYEFKICIEEKEF